MLTAILVLQLMTASGITVLGENAKAFEVDSFGAKPNQKEDSTPGILAAIDAALAAGTPSEVVLGKGTYQIKAPQGRYACFVLDQVKDLTIRGQGKDTLLVITDPRHGFCHIQNCEKVVLKDFRVDYDPLPYTQGTITKISPQAGTFEMDIDEGYSQLSQPWYSEAPEPFGRWGMIFDPQTRFLKAGAPDFIFIKSWSHPLLFGKTWELQVSPGEEGKLASMQLGDRFVHMARGGMGATFFYAGGIDNLIQDVSLHASPGLGIGAVGAKRLHVNRFYVCFPEATDRLLTLDADGVHCQQNRIGPIIENCLFEGMADDAINLYCLPNTILQVFSSTEILISKDTWIQNGDLLQVFNPREGRLIGTVTGELISDTRDGYRIRLSEAVSILQPGTDRHRSDQVLNLSAGAPGYIVRHNTMRRHRRYGMFLKGWNGLVEGNHVHDVGAAGIVVCNDGDWPEGPIPHDVVIRDNTIERGNDGGFYRDSATSALIQVTGTKYGGYAMDRIIKGIQILNNRIIDPPGAAIFLSSLSDILMQDNQVTVHPGVDAFPTTSSVVIKNSEKVRIDHLSVVDQRQKIQAAVGIHADVPQGDAGVTISNLSTMLHPQSVDVKRY